MFSLCFLQVYLFFYVYLIHSVYVPFSNRLVVLCAGWKKLNFGCLWCVTHLKSQVSDDANASDDAAADPVYPKCNNMYI